MYREKKENEKKIHFLYKRVKRHIIFSDLYYMIDTTHLIEKWCLENFIYLCATEYLIRAIRIIVRYLRLFLK